MLVILTTIITGKNNQEKCAWFHVKMINFNFLRSIPDTVLHLLAFTVK